MTEWLIFVPTLCGVVASTISIWRRQWIIAMAMASFSLFTLFDQLILNVVPAPVRFFLFFVGVTLIAIDRARAYKKYKESLSH